MVRASFGLILLFVIAFACNGVHADPAVAPELKRFAPAPWTIDAVAQGDLTGRGTKDAAILMTINPEHAFGAAEDRKLVIVLRGPDGKLHKAAEGTKSMSLGAGPAGGDPEVSIKRNSVFISQFGGSRQKGTETYQYKNMDAQWRLIGFTSERYDSLDENHPFSKTDVNFLTNYVEAELSVDEKQSKTVGLYEIPSVRGTPPASGAWKAPNLVLKTKEKQSNDPVAVVQSMHDDKRLYLLVSVKDNSRQPGDAVRLLTEDGKEIKVVTRERVPTNDGYRETLTFDLSKAPFVDFISMGRVNDEESTFLPFTLEIQDQGAQGVKKLTTAVKAHNTRPHGGVLLMPTSGVPTLTNVNVRDGSVHYLVFGI